jgi:hypothetical protein
MEKYIKDAKSMFQHELFYILTIYVAPYFLKTAAHWCGALHNVIRLFAYHEFDETHLYDTIVAYFEKVYPLVFADLTASDESIEQIKFRSLELLR